MIHWNACVFYFLAQKNEIFQVYMKDFGNDNKTSLNLQFIGHYTNSFYRATLLLTTISNMDNPDNIFERVYLICNFLLGVFVFALVVGSVTEIIDDSNSQRSEFQVRVDAVKNYMHQVNVSSELEERVISWFNHSWSKNRGIDERAVFQDFLPENLQAEIAINMHMETLRRVHIFQDCEPGLLQQLVTRLKLQVFNPSDYVCKKGDIGREMYFIKNGKLSVVSDDGTKVS
jgi:cyclic nucleotide gated channel alpha 3